MSQNILRLNYILKSQMHIHLIEAAKHTPYFTLEELNRIGTECIYTTIINQFTQSAEEEEHVIEYTSKIIILFFFGQILPIEENFIITFNL
jgi:hypothetical protein